MPAKSSTAKMAREELPAIPDTPKRVRISPQKGSATKAVKEEIIRAPSDEVEDSEAGSIGELELQYPEEDDEEEDVEPTYASVAAGKKPKAKPAAVKAKGVVKKAVGKGTSSSMALTEDDLFADEGDTPKRRLSSRTSTPSAKKVAAAAVEEIDDDDDAYVPPKASRQKASGTATTPKGKGILRKQVVLEPVDDSADVLSSPSPSKLGRVVVSEKAKKSPVKKPLPIKKSASAMEDDVFGSDIEYLSEKSTAPKMPPAEEVSNSPSVRKRVAEAPLVGSSKSGRSLVTTPPRKLAPNKGKHRLSPEADHPSSLDAEEKPRKRPKPTVSSPPKAVAKMVVETPPVSDAAVPEPGPHAVANRMFLRLLFDSLSSPFESLLEGRLDLDSGHSRLSTCSIKPKYDADDAVELPAIENTFLDIKSEYGQFALHESLCFGGQGVLFNPITGDPGSLTMEGKLESVARICTRPGGTGSPRSVVFVLPMAVRSCELTEMVVRSVHEPEPAMIRRITAWPLAFPYDCFLSTLGTVFRREEFYHYVSQSTLSFSTRSESTHRDSAASPTKGAVPRWGTGSACRSGFYPQSLQASAEVPIYDLRPSSRYSGFTWREEDWDKLSSLPRFKNSGTNNNIPDSTSKDYYLAMVAFTVNTYRPSARDKLPSDALLLSLNIMFAMVMTHCTNGDVGTNSPPLSSLDGRYFSDLRSRLFPEVWPPAYALGEEDVILGKDPEEAVDDVIAEEDEACGGEDDQLESEEE